MLRHQIKQSFIENELDVTRKLRELLALRNLNFFHTASWLNQKWKSTINLIVQKIELHYQKEF